MNDIILWKETLKVDGFSSEEPESEESESEEIEEIEENEGSEENEENEEIEEIIAPYDVEKEEREMKIDFDNELEILFTDKIPSDKMTLVKTMDEYNNIPRTTTILVYNIPYFMGFKLPKPEQVPLLSKLVVYISHPIEDYTYPNSGLFIHYYPNLSYLSVFTSSLYAGVVLFAPPPVEEMEYTPLSIISLKNVKIDLENDQGLPVGLGVTRLFLYLIQ